MAGNGSKAAKKWIAKRKLDGTENIDLAIEENGGVRGSGLGTLDVADMDVEKEKFLQKISSYVRL